MSLTHDLRHHVRADSDPELFWALRGGGGDFGAVTALELDLHPAPRLYGRRMLWPADRARHVIDAFRAITTSGDIPDDLAVWVDLSATSICRCGGPNRWSSHRAYTASTASPPHQPQPQYGAVDLRSRRRHRCGRQYRGTGAHRAAR
jgi:hypothetical protein